MKNYKLTDDGLVTSDKSIAVLVLGKSVRVFRSKNA